MRPSAVCGVVIISILLKVVDCASPYCLNNPELSDFYQTELIWENDGWHFLPILVFKPTTAHDIMLNKNFTFTLKSDDTSVDSSFQLSRDQGPESNLTLKDGFNITNLSGYGNKSFLIEVSEVLDQCRSTHSMITVNIIPTTTSTTTTEDTKVIVLSAILALVIPALLVALVFIYRYRKFTKIRKRQTAEHPKEALIDLAEPAIKKEEENRDNRLYCNIKPPPSQVQGTHRQIIRMIKATCVAKQLELKNDGQNPTLVTVVSSSRAKADIERDMKAAKLTSSESAIVILLRIIPVKDPTQRVEKIRSENYVLDLTFLADYQIPIQLHNCSHNEEQSKELMNYLLEQKNI